MIATKYLSSALSVGRRSKTFFKVLAFIICFIILQKYLSRHLLKFGEGLQVTIKRCRQSVSQVVFGHFQRLSSLLKSGHFLFRLSGR